MRILQTEDLSQVFSAVKDLELKLEEGANTQGEAGSADQSLCRWDPATVLALGEAGSASQLPSLSSCIT